MKRYVQSFDNIRMPSDLAERIQKAAEAPQIPQHKIPRRRVALICAACLLLALGLPQLSHSPTLTAPTATAETAANAPTEEILPPATTPAEASLEETPPPATTPTDTEDTPQKAESAPASVITQPEETAPEIQSEKTTAAMPSAPVPSVDDAIPATDSPVTESAPPEETTGDVSEDASILVGSGTGGSLPTGNPTMENSIQTVDSPQALAQLLQGMPLPTMPAAFSPETCTLRDGIQGEILYTYDGQTVCFRAIAGSENLGGNYTDFQETMEIQGESIICQGKDGMISVALWQKNGFSCRLDFSQPVTQTELAAWLK